MTYISDAANNGGHCTRVTCGAYACRRGPQMHRAEELEKL